MAMNQRDLEQLDRLDESLTNQPPTPDAIVDIERLREAAKAYGHLLIELTPNGRERALAITKLEESVMWGVKSIVLP
jgi:hypothetical protein